MATSARSAGGEFAIFYPKVIIRVHLVISVTCKPLTYKVIKNKILVVDTTIVNDSMTSKGFMNYHHDLVHITDSADTPLYQKHRDWRIEQSQKAL